MTRDHTVTQFFVFAMANGQNRVCSVFKKNETNKTA